MMSEDLAREIGWPSLFAVPLEVCEACLLSLGDECHTPGCSFWMQDVPSEELAERLRDIAGVVRGTRGSVVALAGLPGESRKDPTE